MNLAVRKLPLALGALVVLCFSAARSHAAIEAVPRNMKFGDSGADVALLQKILNQDPDTRVASTGPGSPGKETNYFGPATRAAVSRFQKKYERDTLAPVGLNSPTGFVGVFTRKKLNNLFTSGSQSASPSPNSGSAAKGTTGVPSDTGRQLPGAATSSSPNLENIDFYLTHVADFERAKGVGAETIAEHARAIRQYAAATSTDFRKQFEEDLKRSISRSRSDDSFSEGVLSMIQRIFQPIIDSFIPPAHAIVGVPFGGPILYVFPCSCPPGIFSLGVGPPSFSPILDYAVGTQAFLSYNLPAARFLLGFFEPGVPSCWQFAVLGCFPIPSGGLISPMVGSSPL